MNNKKIWKVYLDETYEKILKKIIKSKEITIQALLQEFLKNYLLENLDCVIDDERE